MNCIRYPGSRWLMGRAVLKSLKQTTLLTFFDICKSWGIVPGEHFKYNANDGVIKWSNESEIYLKDLQFQPRDPEFDQLGSTEYTGAFIDEGSQVSSKAKNVIISRLRYKHQEFDIIPKIMIGTNPCKTFLYYDFYKPWRNKTLPKHRAFVQSFVQDNPYIDPQYIENLKKLDKTTRERLLLGNWEYDSDDARLFDYADLLDMFTNTVPKSEDKFLTVDVARLGADKTTVYYWEGWAVKDIWEYAKRRTNETEDLINQKAAEKMVKRSHIAIDEDGVGGGVVDHISGCRGFVNNASPIQRPNANYANLKSQCYFFLADYVKAGKVAIQVQNEQFKEKIIEELEQIKRKDPDKDAKVAVEPKKMVKDALGRSPDHADAIMMRMLFEVSPQEVRILQDPDNVMGLS